jgi:hypothetical protein
MGESLCPDYASVTREIERADQALFDDLDRTLTQGLGVVETRRGPVAERPEHHREVAAGPRAFRLALPWAKIALHPAHPRPHTTHVIST